MHRPPTSSTGFIALYRWSVEAEHEAAFRRNWREATLQVRKLGGYGSCLTRDQDGCFVAIALWPSEAARAVAFSAMEPSPAWPGACRLSETRLDVEDDLWASSPFTGGQ
jgi:hypothetical protein